MKKILSLIILLAMILSCVGCIKGPDDVGGADDNIDWNVDLSNPITLKAMYPSTGISGFGRDDSAKIIEAKTGYRVDYSELSASNADNDVSNIFLNQDQYQILKLTEAQYHPNAKDGSLLDLTSLLKNTEQGRLLYALIDLMDYGWDAVTYTTPDGKTGIYAIPDFGYCVMEDSALVWNSEHLKAIGYVNEDGSARTPETMSEFNDALEKLQTKYGASNSKYHAFTIPGANSSNINTIMSMFECPNEYYLDENGNINFYVFDESVANYCEYMNGLRGKGIISTTWQNADNASCISNFSDEECSVTYMTYWWVESLVNSIVTKGTLASKAEVKNDYQSVHDNCIIWNTRLRGDGTNGTINQEKARMQGGDDGVSYYTAIPYYMAKDALYVIDYLSKKLLYFSEYYGGTGLSKEELAAKVTTDGEAITDEYIENNVHWMEIDAPAGAKAYYANGDYDYQAYEDYSEKIIYLRPYEYTVSYEIDTKLEHIVNAGETKTIKSHTQTYVYSLNGTTMTLKVNGGGIWVKLTDRYMAQIVDNSQYCTGTNSVSANVLFHLRETGFDAWQVTVPMDETIIKNPMSMMPPLEHWAPISILSRTVAKRGIASAIDATSGTPTAALNITRKSLTTKYNKSSDGTKYYYWSEEIVNEMTNWYKTVKVNRK